MTGLATSEAGAWLWLLGFFAFEVASGLIHILLVVALIVVVLHFVRGRAG